ncbi:hypothetical protein [Chitinophaga sp.]|uniref:hypothetical protein n=1 Tax=Chitinophaga sp. TaxID=1869181 RepID=UPI0031D5949F
MSKEGNNRRKVGTMRTNSPKSNGFSRKISRVAVKRAVHSNHPDTLAYKELVQKHSAAIAFLYEQEDRELDNMLRDLQLLKSGKFK